MQYNSLLTKYTQKINDESYYEYILEIIEEELLIMVDYY